MRNIGQGSTILLTYKHSIPRNVSSYAVKFLSQFYRQAVSSLKWNRKHRFQEPLHFEIVGTGTVPGKEIEVAGEATHLLNDGNTVILRNGGTGTEVIHDSIAWCMPVWPSPITQTRSSK